VEKRDVSGKKTTPGCALTQPGVVGVGENREAVRSIISQVESYTIKGGAAGSLGLPPPMEV
jgi:hypothetical protein